MGAMGFAIVAVAITVGAAAYYIGLGIDQARSVDRLTALQRSRSELLREGFAARALAPIFERFGGWALRFTPVGWPTRTRRRLVLAGWEDSIDVASWAALKTVSAVVSLVAWLAAQTQVSGTLDKLLLLGLFAFMGLFLPDGILNNRIEERRRAMRNQLPDILDLLVISTEAGLGFEAALARVVETVPGPMSDEFRRMLRETRVGVSRNEAMQHLSERADIEELNSFLLAMSQADQFGVSVARVLRVQSEEMRSRRRQRAQERALTAPVKMVFPLVFCIFPALFVVLLGPAAVEIFRNVLD